MEALSVTHTAPAGPSSEASSPIAHDDDTRSSPYTLPFQSTPKQALVTISASEHDNLASKDAKHPVPRLNDDVEGETAPSSRLRSSRMFQDIGEEVQTTEKEQKEPLRLLDLPVDILKDIVKEVTHTNDLTSLALCHSALHRLAIPHIYSRFDIVWPDIQHPQDTRSGVDALTYGLATLVMAEEIFGEAPGQRQQPSSHNRSTSSGSAKANEMDIRRRRGNHYAQFTRKFSLGNGPHDWVQEYLITKEGGKMLGTLVALAIARMRSLEAFIWDMPTGILRDVWISLASLGDPRSPHQAQCRLEKVWVRWHDNSSTIEAPQLPPGITAIPPAPMALQGGSQTNMTQAMPTHTSTLDRVERPSFSQLPPLKSLSVLDIDELAYLDEMAVLIGRSADKLRELRVGIARQAMTANWVTVWEGDNLQQVDANFPTSGCETIGDKRLGGVMGVLTGFVHDIRQSKVVSPEPAPRSSSSTSAVAGAPVAALSAEADNGSTAHSAESNLIVRDEIINTPAPDSTAVTDADADVRALNDEGISVTQDRTVDDANEVPESALAFTSPSPEQEVVQPEDEAPDSSLAPTLAAPTDAAPTNAASEHSSLGPKRMLSLENLELERVPLFVPVMQKAIDWTRLTSLTLLNCLHHEQLWKTLRKTLAPTPKVPTYPLPRRTAAASPQKPSKSDSDAYDFPLALKKIHTNTVSPALVSFIKDALAPNSLETLFLQEARSYNSTVTIDAIYKGPIRRHRTSLRKVLIDSVERDAAGKVLNSSRTRKWIAGGEILKFLCSGKMEALRELGIVVDYRDWHFLLQSLPSIAQLRSLYIPFLADHVHGAGVDPRELALQVVDIVSLRPEIELCYLGIASKCFEILECDSPCACATTSGHGGLVTPAGIGLSAPDDEDEDDDEDEGEDEDGEDDEDEPSDDDTESEGSVVSDAAAAEKDPKLRLREILFYDDKVAVFKARHGKL